MPAFTVPDASNSFVDGRTLTATTKASTVTGQGIVALTWNSLADWGAGDVQVAVAYTYKIAGVTYSATKSKTVSAVDGFNGTTVGSLLGIGQKLTSVRVQKQVDGDAWVTIYDQAGGGSPSNRLVLQGDTTGVSGIVIDGYAGPLAAFAIGGSNLAVDIAELPCGSYVYHLIRDGVTKPRAPFRGEDRTPAFFGFGTGDVWVRGRQRESQQAMVHHGWRRVA